MAENLTLISHFDINYAARGITMINSAEKHSALGINWKVLALDSETYELLKNLDRPNIEVYNIEQVGSDLLVIRKSRTYREFCWSAGAIFMDFILRISLKTQYVGYIDADCYFFGDVSTCFTALGGEKNIGAHGHNFPEKRKHWEETVGKFNVGLVIGRKSKELETCIKFWKDQVLESCTEDTSTGKFGDQKYLDSWPDLYSGFIELKSFGVGLAPWNIDHLRLTKSFRGIKINQDEVIFYHFHGIHQIFNLNSFAVFQAARGYSIKQNVRRNIYVPYLRELVYQAEKLGIPPISKTPVVLSKLDIRNLYSTLPFKLGEKLVAIL